METFKIEDLYDQDRHQAWSAKTWDETLAWNTIHKIVQSSITLLKDSDARMARATSLYAGDTGVLLALKHLDKIGVECKVPNTDQLADEILEAYLSQNSQDSLRHSLYFGEPGVRYVRSLVTKDPDNERLIRAWISKNLESCENEIGWGSGGLLLLCLAMYRQTEDPFYQEAFFRGADVLYARWRYHEDLGHFMWTQDLRGLARYFGYFHGAVGNISVLLRGFDLFGIDSGKRLEIIQRTEQFLTAHNRHPNLYNLPGAIGISKRLVQICHGATGLIWGLTSTSAYRESQTIQEILWKAGELVYHAGPLTKGNSFCHGNTGSGWALLRLFEATDNQTWLQRAQKFAMEACKGTGDKPGLYTGDAGLALFLINCIRKSSVSLPAVL